MDLSAYRAIQQKNLTDEQMKRDLEYAKKVDALGLKAPNKIPIPKVNQSQSQSNNPPSVSKPAGTLPRVSAPKQMGIGFNQPTTLPRISQPKVVSLPKVEPQVLQKAQQLSQQAQGKTVSKNVTPKSVAGANAWAGLGQFNAGLAKTLDFILPDVITPKVVQRGLDYYKNTATAQAEHAAKVNEEKGVPQWAGQLIQGTAAAVPNAILAMMSGGASLGTQALGQTSTGLAGTITTAMQTIAKTPTFYTSLAQTMGPAYEEAKANGASELEAQAVAIIGGFVNAGVEIGGGIETVAANPASLTNWVRSMLDEGKEEVLQGVVEQLMAKATYDKGKQWASATDENAVINPGRMANEFASGAVVGGVLGGGQMLTGKALGSLNLQPAQENYQKGIDNSPEQVYNGSGKSLNDLDIETASWEEINNSPEIIAARERAAFDRHTNEDNSFERQVLRQKVQNELYALGSFTRKVGDEELFEGPVKQDRKAFIVIGPPAAGKSSVFANPLSKDYSARIIDSDMAKKRLPEFDEGFGASHVHEESSDIADHLFAQAVANGDNIVYPLVGKNADKIRAIKDGLKQEGYRVELYLNELPAEKAARRAVRRFVKENRLVDSNYVLSVGDKPNRTYDILREEGGFDRYVRKSNDVAYGQQPISIEDYTPGEDLLRLVGDRGQAHRQHSRTAEKQSIQNQVTDTKPGVGSSLPKNSGYGTNTVGSAQANPNSYAHLQNQYGTVEPGENPVRVIDMPVKDADGRKTSLFARTVAESNSMPNEMVPEWEQAVASGDFSHDIATDKAANRYAERELGKGWDNAMRQWRAVSEGNKIATKNDLALGQALLANAMKDGDTQTAMQLTAELCAEATRAGQAVQSFRLLKKMTPEGMLYYLQKTVNNLNSDFEGRRGFEGIKIDEGMAERLGKATTREEMNAIVDEIKQDIAAQTPVTWYDKWNAWRYLSMLGNPTTQIRNVFGNALFLPVVKTKNLIATGIEAAYKKTGRLPYATKAVLTAKDKGLVDYANKDFDNVVQEIQGGGKYTDKDEILGNRQIFKNKFLEGYRILTDTCMEKGDEIFSRQHYKASLAQYMKANKLNPDSITPEQLNKARRYAVQEAQRATYRDASSVASLVNRAKRTLANTANNKENDLGKRAAARAGEVLLEGFVPFTKTPVNIVKRGIEYSPIGLAQGTVNLVRSVKNGEVDAAAAIDRMAAGLTGSGLLGLGMWLASMGLVSGGPGEDDREEKYKGMLGEQDYALKLGDTTYTIDWLAPEALPFFTGVELYKEMQSKDGITLADTIGLISAMSDPIVELSMLSSMNSSFESIKYSQGDALSTVTGNLITSYLGQGIPTIGGKIARTIDETSRQTYYDPNKTGIVKSADVFRQKAQAKLPFDELLESVTGGKVQNSLQPRVDLWGRTEKNTGGNIAGRFFYNMLSPGYAESKNVTKVDNELLRLAEATGDSNVYPDTADKTFKVKGESVKLNAKQYTQFAKTKGQTAFDILEAAVDSSTYKKMTDAEKTDFVKDVYEYANAKAKAEVSSYQLDGKNAKIAQAEKKGIKPTQYLTITGGYDKDGNGSVTQEEAKAVLDKTNLTTAQKAYMWKLQNKSWKTNPYE